MCSVNFVQSAEFMHLRYMNIGINISEFEKVSGDAFLIELQEAMQ